MNVWRMAWKSANSGPPGESTEYGMPAAARSTRSILAASSDHSPGQIGCFLPTPAINARILSATSTGNGWGINLRFFAPLAGGVTVGGVPSKWHIIGTRMASSPTRKPVDAAKM
ncbi:hypothetical protein [Limnoglobus roseus]|uniref:Uncharacterized protein n=1 Tax=Limnoglobus roseus TaxID=2598579 RepID=A0A5C1A6T1_9BACT|nr:hypothetical protein [Limnoglobus roseus]QEL14959.1 hypothetical protein PX52LOC_01862 [Limnoglobus roseus]